MSKKLFDASDESDNEDDVSFNTNADYAKSYNNFRKKELVKKFKDRGYEVDDTDSSSDSSDSLDDDDAAMNVKFDQEFFKTLASLKSRDPSIYDKNTCFFAEESLTKEDKSNVKMKSKPITLKDYERQIILERDGKYEDDSDAEAVPGRQRTASPTIAEEERHLKNEFKKLLNTDDSEEEEFGGIFKKRNKTNEEQIQEDEDFTKWLAGKEAKIEEKAKEKLESLKMYWNSNKLPQSERFLRDYILSKGYADTKTSEIPTYDEIVRDDNGLSQDEEELEKQAEFEHKYNFRFEEPDSEFIKRYPRTIDNSVRRTDDKRKQKRHEQKQRKEQEKEQKMKELEMVKEMKRKEIEEKIRKLKAVTGNDELGFNDAELEEEFDPEAHDRRMQEIFNDEYYKVDEGEEKPECPSDIDELKTEDWDNYDPQRETNLDQYEAHCEDADFNMDCDYDPMTSKEALQNELIENTKGRRNRRGRRNRFMEMIQTEKPAFNPEDEKTYAEYIDEYYKMDCEDVVGDMPCRFKYVETTPNDFGLTIEEILLAKNKELNQWASLKKAIQIRPEHQEKKEQRLFRLKAQNEELKRKIFRSLYGDYGEGSDNEEETESVRKAANGDDTNKHDDVRSEIQVVEIENGGKCKKRRKRKNRANGNNGEPEGQSKIARLGNTFNGDVQQDSKISNGAVVIDGNRRNPFKKGTEESLKNVETVENGVTVNSQAINKMKRKRQKEKEISNGKIDNSTSKPGTTFKINQDAISSKLQRKKQGLKKPNKQIQQSKLFGSNIKKRNSLNNKTKRKFTNNENDTKISDDRLKAYGINPKKFHKKQKYKKTQNVLN